MAAGSSEVNNHAQKGKLDMVKLLGDHLYLTVAADRNRLRRLDCEAGSALSSDRPALLIELAAPQRLGEIDCVAAVPLPPTALSGSGSCWLFICYGLFSLEPE